MKELDYSHNDYHAVCDFLITLNRETNAHINWNWARWEWMYCHPYCDREHLHTIGLWKNGETVVGAAIYDLFPGEAFCAALPEYSELLPEILKYAYHSLKDDNGLGIAVRDGDKRTTALLEQLGYQKAEQSETVLCLSLDQLAVHKLPEIYGIQEIHFPEDNLAYQTVIWKGFDHEGDEAELERMLNNAAPLPPHRDPRLCLAVVDKAGEFAAHCTCWYDQRTDYAYVEPVCTIPAHRGKGLAKAVVTHALQRCKTQGATRAFVLSDLPLYKQLGFLPHSHYTFFHKP